VRIRLTQTHLHNRRQYLTQDNWSSGEERGLEHEDTGGWTRRGTCARTAIQGGNLAVLNDFTNIADDH
jgi:hypothetical protein